MLEFPEAIALSKQINRSLVGKAVASVFASNASHKFAFFNGDPSLYEKRLKGKTLREAKGIGPFLEMHFDDLTLLCGDGVSPRFSKSEAEIPKKYQLLIGFTDGTYLSCTVQMYGSMMLFGSEGFDNEYYRVACDKPNPLTKAFDMTYFMQLVEEAPKSLSVKGLLATEQRIPGLGNGVLQDILFKAKILPQRKVNTLDREEIRTLHQEIKATLTTMIEQNGRNTEKGLSGSPGDYPVILSSKSYQKPCPVCDGAITKKAFLGGSVYFCPSCQK